MKMEKEATKNEILEIIEKSVLLHIQGLMKQVGRPVDNKEAKNILGHIAKKVLLDF